MFASMQQNCRFVLFLLLYHLSHTCVQSPIRTDEKYENLVLGSKFWEPPICCERFCIYSVYIYVITSVKMVPELRRYIQHISLSPDSINNDDVRLRVFFATFCSYSCWFPVCSALTLLMWHVPGCLPSHEVLTRHHGHPHRNPCEGKSGEVIAVSFSLLTANMTSLVIVEQEKHTLISGTILCFKCAWLYVMTNLLLSTKSHNQTTTAYDT